MTAFAAAAADEDHAEIQRLRARIQQLEDMLSAVGAGGVSKLIPSVQADSVILSRDLTAAIISIINDSKTQHGDQLAREFWAIERLVEALEKGKSRQVKSQQQSNLSTDYQVERLC